MLARKKRPTPLRDSQILDCSARQKLGRTHRHGRDARVLNLVTVRATRLTCFNLDIYS